MNEQDRFNQDVDNLLQGKDVEMSQDNQEMIDLAEELMKTDFSHESRIRKPLRQRLLQRRQMMLQSKTMENTLPRLSLTWLVAVLAIVIVGGLFLVFRPNGGPESGAFGSTDEQRASGTPPPTMVPTPTLVQNPTVPPMPTMPFTATPLLPPPPGFSETATSPYHMISVVVATQNIAAGTEIDASMLTVVQWPVTSVPSASFVLPEQLVGKTTVVQIPRWSPVLEGHVMLEGDEDRAVLTVLPALLTFGDRSVEVNVAVAADPDDLPDEVSAEVFSLTFSTEDARLFEWALEAESPITIQVAE